MTTFLDLHNRYVLECSLQTETGLHIGSGAGGPATDAPFVRQGGLPFLPGSSLRGTLRSTVERIARSLGGASRFCTQFEQPAAGGCHRDEPSEKQEKLFQSGALHFCPMCSFFGCTGVAAKLKISDAAFAGAAIEPVRRDGVGIDRDTETARDKIKFDFEVLQPGCIFTFCMHLENADDADFALLFIMLREMQQGFYVGGKKARGLGRVKLEGYKASYFDNGSDRPLRAFLTLGLKEKPTTEFEAWLETKFAATFPEAIPC
jgi:CRISPR-associated RAMP protein (TIGR02581 family)